MILYTLIMSTISAASIFFALPYSIWWLIAVFIYVGLWQKKKNAWYAGLIVNSFGVLIMILRFLNDGNFSLFTLLASTLFIILILHNKPYYFPKSNK